MVPTLGTPRRRHGPRRLALVPHAPRDPVRTRRPLRLDRLLRPDLLRLVLSGELRGRARGRRCSPSTATSSRRCSTSAGSAWASRRPTAIGRPYGLGPQSLIGGAIALGAQNLVEFQAGRGAQRHRRGLADPRGRRDSRERRGCARGRGPRPTLWPLGIAGLAAGLAAGTKLSFLAPVVALFVGLVVIAPSGSRIRTAALVRAPGAAHRRLLVRAQPDRDRQPDPVHVVRAARAADAGANARAAPRLLGLSLRDRLRRLVGLVLSRARRLVRLPMAARPGCVRRRRRLRAVARARPVAAGARGGRAVHRARVPVHPADRSRRGGEADRLRLERPLPGAGGRDRARDPALSARPAGRRTVALAHPRRALRAVRRDGDLARPVAAGARQGGGRRRGRRARLLRGDPVAALPRSLGRRRAARLGAPGSPPSSRSGRSGPGGGSSATISSAATRT